MGERCTTAACMQKEFRFRVTKASPMQENVATAAVIDGEKSLADKFMREYNREL